jgi:hypothetical protein
MVLEGKQRTAHIITVCVYAGVSLMMCLLLGSRSALTSWRTATAFAIALVLTIGSLLALVPVLSPGTCSKKQAHPARPAVAMSSSTPHAKKRHSLPTPGHRRQ